MSVNPFKLDALRGTRYVFTLFGQQFPTAVANDLLSPGTFLEHSWYHLRNTIARRGGARLPVTGSGSKCRQPIHR